MATLHPYLRFTNTCAEAMNFYKSVFGGELTMQKVGDSPAKDHMPPETHNSIMHSMLKADDILFMASDMTDPQQAKEGNITLALVGKSGAEIKELFEKLSVGANVTQPLKEEFFGTFGSLVDKFGISWMFQAEPEKK